MADTAEADTDVPLRGLNGHVAEGYVVAHMSAELARRKVEGVLAKELPVSEELQMLMENWKALKMSFRRWKFTLRT